jgi:hypothetical protein
MPVLKGYRTLLFNAVMAIATVTGHVLVPATATSLVDLVMLLGASTGNILLRLITTTPFGRAAVEVAEQVVKLHPDVLAALGDAVTDAVQVAMHDTVSGPAPLSEPPPPDTDLVALASHITGALATVQSVHAQMAAALSAANVQVADALPVALAPAPADPTPQPAPVPQPAALAGQQK